MKLDTLEDLYIHELKDLYSAEQQLLKALPKMVKTVGDKDLKKALEKHLAETERHVNRLEKIFSKRDQSPKGHKCRAMQGLIEEAEELFKSDIDPQVLDAALIAAAQRVEHYEMAGYGTARTYAEKLGDFAAADLLQETLFEESQADNKLSRLAERKINSEALVAE